jgi:hypothetical protein
MLTKRLLPAAGALAAAALVAASASGLASTGAHTLPQTPRATAAASDPTRTTAMRRYRQEVSGQVAHNTLARLARDRGLVAAVRSGSTSRLGAYVAAKYRPVWYHWHVSRLRIARGSTTLVEVGVPFVVAGPKMTLRDAHGRPTATLEISVQDVIGYVRYMHRNAHVDVVVRGRGADVRTSLPAALRMRLPDSGAVTIAGRRYRVTSFRATAWQGEPVQIWILR